MVQIKEIQLELKERNQKSWSRQEYDLFWNRLTELSETEYANFISKLIPEYERRRILGIRLPILRKIALMINKGNTKSYFDCVKERAKEETPLLLEEKLVWAFVIGKLKCWKETKEEILCFVPYIDCWSVNDSFCASLKIAEVELENMFEVVKNYLKSNQDYEIRFAVVMLLEYYVNDEYIDQTLKLLDRDDWTGYYVQMAVAWAISCCYIAYKEKTLELLKHCRLDSFTYNKSLQKIVESKRLTPSEKCFVKSLKRIV